MGDFFDVLKREFGRGIREGLRPNVAFALEQMYGHIDLGSRTWEQEADEFLSHMRDHARAKRASK